MKIKCAYYSKRCPGQLIVETPDGKRYWCRMVPARKLEARDLLPLPKSYHCIQDYTLLAAEAKSLYALEYAYAETAR